jgi:malate dehydrogenase (oxaloacetate-decarboxylating)
MEGKAALYDRFAGISATPMLVDTLDAETFIDTVVLLSPPSAASTSKTSGCPSASASRRSSCPASTKPVMHDDQHGTATVALAALINACKLTGVDPRASRMGQIGLGAAGSAIARMALAYGARRCS